ncbi:hypothetical protein [Wolbachia endosymbiont of Wuchereria bancrofti]|uniref:hypothetical protein n=1 Tax=Wolbachia endosymbiont of Wuchereria bancrofti TaxID=96496 RepID=UPI000348E2D4|nr:hypothetical protein [Wolbachia endosymbiont of Wuchereria bancrofti]OWZ25644.1 hypothetical protein CCY16_00487 [Wolbachia endosymbiont of Wuchereria bancrofti]
MSKDGGVKTEESNEFTDGIYFGSTEGSGLIDNDYSNIEGVSTEENEALEEQLGDMSQELELERLQNVSLKEESREL